MFGPFAEDKLMLGCFGSLDALTGGYLQRIVFKQGFPDRTHNPCLHTILVDKLPEC